jgi:hypothetical protein
MIVPAIGPPRPHDCESLPNRDGRRGAAESTGHWGSQRDSGAGPRATRQDGRRSADKQQIGSALLLDHCGRGRSEPILLSRNTWTSVGGGCSVSVWA